MFDFAWSEIALIGVVALVLIGPKDLPVAIKAVSDMVKKARRMASELQGHVDEMVKDTSIAEVRQQINEIRNFDIRGEIERAVDADGAIRSSIADDPFRQLTPHAASPRAEAAAELEAHRVATPEPAAARDATALAAPAFVPPAATQVAPAFIPPDTAQPGAARA